MNEYLRVPFMYSTLLVAVPTGVKFFSWVATMWGGKIETPTPMLFVIGAILVFLMGGLSGPPHATVSVDLHLHDTYYVIAHFHYIVAPGVLFGLFAGIYHWFPKATGRMMSSFLGHLHFWPSLVFMNAIFAPMFLQGMHGFHRRWYNGGAAYERIGHDIVVAPFRQFFEWFGIKTYLDLNIFVTWSAFGLAIAQVPFIINFFLSEWLYGGIGLRGM